MMTMMMMKMKMVMMVMRGWLAGARYLAVSELELAVLAVPGSCS